MKTHEIIGVLGEGGMGTVFRARHLGLDREVALKIIRSDGDRDETLVRRFRREVEACAALAHPNVVKVLDFGEADDGRLYYTMELLQAQTLKDLAGAGHLDCREVADYLLQAADALAYIHERSLLHRDIKPANIMVDPRGHLTLMDFGLVKMVGRTLLTAQGDLLGTPRYMAPEAFQGHECDREQDVYALGVTFWEALSGRNAFGGLDLKGLILRKVQGSLEPVTRYREDVPEWLSELLARATSSDPRERPSASGIVQALRSQPAPRQAAGARATKKVRSSRDSDRTPAVRSIAASPLRMAMAAGACVLLLACALSPLARSPGPRPPEPAAPLALRPTVPSPANALQLRDLVCVVGDTTVLVDFRMDEFRPITVEIVPLPNAGSRAAIVRSLTLRHYREVLRGLSPDTDYALGIRPREGAGGIGEYRFRTQGRIHRRVVDAWIALLDTDVANLGVGTPDLDPAIVAPSVAFCKKRPEEALSNFTTFTWIARETRSRELTDVLQSLAGTDPALLKEVVAAAAYCRHPCAPAIGRRLLAATTDHGTANLAAEALSTARDPDLGDPSIGPVEACDLIAAALDRSPPCRVDTHHMVVADRSRAREHFLRWLSASGPESGERIHQALPGFAEVATPADLPLLERLLLEWGPHQVSVSAAAPLAAIPGGPELLERISRERPDRWELPWALASRGPPESAAVLEPMFDRATTPAQRRDLLCCLGILHSPTSVPVLRKALRETDPEVLEAACWALAKLRDQGSGPSIEGLAGTRADWRGVVCYALGETGHRAAVPRLRTLLEQRLERRTPDDLAAAGPTAWALRELLSDVDLDAVKRSVAQARLPAPARESLEHALSHSTAPVTQGLREFLLLPVSPFERTGLVLEPGSWIDCTVAGYWNDAGSGSAPARVTNEQGTRPGREVTLVATLEIGRRVEAPPYDTPRKFFSAEGGELLLRSFYSIGSTREKSPIGTVHGMARVRTGFQRPRS